MDHQKRVYNDIFELLPNEVFALQMLLLTPQRKQLCVFQLDAQRNRLGKASWPGFPFHLNSQPIPMNRFRSRCYGPVRFKQFHGDLSEIRFHIEM